MPFATHSEDLRKFYLRSDLAEGRLHVEGRPVVISDMRATIFAVGTERDPVAARRSAYELTALADTEVTFAPTSDGHDGGIVSEPGHPRRSYRIGTRGNKDRDIGPDGRLERTDPQEGSWWGWLDARSGPPTAPPDMGSKASDYATNADTPDTCMLQRQLVGTMANVSEEGEGQ